MVHYFIMALVVFIMMVFTVHAYLSAGEGMQIVQKEVANILQGRVLVGHALHNDLKVASCFELNINK